MFCQSSNSQSCGKPQRRNIWITTLSRDREEGASVAHLPGGDSWRWFYFPAWGLGTIFPAGFIKEYWNFFPTSPVSCSHCFKYTLGGKGGNCSKTSYIVFVQIFIFSELHRIQLIWRKGEKCLWSYSLEFLWISIGVQEKVTRESLKWQSQTSIFPCYYMLFNMVFGIFLICFFFAFSPPENSSDFKVFPYQAQRISQFIV